MAAESTVSVAGCPVTFQRLGPRDARRVILVHGGAAHKGWWSGVAPALARRFDVLVPDLSGHGASGRRDHYSPEQWADELAALITLDGASRPAGVVGHSMGGLVSIYLAARRPELIDRLIVVDSALRRPDANGDAPRGRPMRGTRYPSREAALRRFRLNPPQTTASSDVLRGLATEAVRRTGDRWTWTTDPGTRQRFTDLAVRDQLEKVACRFGFIYGDRSSITGPETRRYLQDVLRRPFDAICVRNSYHHVPLDAPESCTEAIEYLLDAQAS